MDKIEHKVMAKNYEPGPVSKERIEEEIGLEPTIQLDVVDVTKFSNNFGYKMAIKVALNSDENFGLLPNVQSIKL